MKATQKNFASHAVKAAKHCRVFFFCGQDEAGASAAADKICELLPEAGERVEMAGADLRKDPALLGDEARSGSLFGDVRHIYVRANGDEACAALEYHLEGEGEACPVLVVATSATDKSRTAKLLEKRDDALVAMFYPPDLSTVSGSVRTMADAAGLRLGGDMAERIARNAGLDVRLAQSEITKLALYLDADPQSPKTVDADALNAIGAQTEEDDFMPLVNAVLSGETAKLSAELRRMREVSMNPVGLLLAFERRASQLARIASALGPRGNLTSMGRGEKAALGVFWKEERNIIDQLRCWPPAKMSRLVERLMELHRSLMANNQGAELLLANELTAIARFARGKARQA